MIAEAVWWWWVEDVAGVEVVKFIGGVDINNCGRSGEEKRKVE